jgi:hypothetical protein
MPASLPWTHGAGSSRLRAMLGAAGLDPEA